eukprot:GGOE01014664.1.p1 GENE.GGOE01014664.1~~GGOE01014664.1.p1  ORF type:complete len:504 (-),score=106.72 GGOE01014664.1:142-1653(-)
MFRPLLFAALVAFLALSGIGLRRSTRGAPKPDTSLAQAVQQARSALGVSSNTTFLAFVELGSSAEGMAGPNRGPFPSAPEHVTWWVPPVQRVRAPPHSSFRDPVWSLVTRTEMHHDPKQWKGNMYSLRRILELQFPPRCSRTLEGHIRSGEGLFSTINQVAGAMSLAWRLNRTFIPRGGPIYYAPTEECRRAPWKGEYSWWNCLFMPITNCTPGSIKFQKGKKNFLEVKVANIYQHVDHFAELIRLHYEVPPQQPAHILHNANVMSFLFRPVPAFTRYAAQVRRWLGLDTAPYAAVHIRRTDKGDTEFVHHTAAYLDLVVAHAPAEVSTVFVMTDKAAVLNEIEELRARHPPYQRFRFVSKPEERPEAGATEEFKYSAHPMNPVRHTAEFLANVLIAANSSLFVGTCNSHIGRALMGLLAARTTKLNLTRMVDEQQCKFHAERWFNFLIGNPHNHTLNRNYRVPPRPRCMHVFCTPAEMRARNEWDRNHSRVRERRGLQYGVT